MKKIALAIFLLIILITTNVFATTDVTMKIVEDNICTIKLNEYSQLEKKIISSNLEKHEVTLQLKVTNNAEVIIPSGELMLVLDGSSSMDETIEGQINRKDIILKSANKLVTSLLKANPTSLKIGVVTFSNSLEENEDGYLITGTEKDAQKVCDLTNDANKLTKSISEINGTGQYTNLDAGLKLAKSQFSNEKNNKYMIVLTDGLPNLAVGHNDLVSYDGLTKIIAETKSTLTSLKDVDVITMLTGVDDEEIIFRTDGINSYTYGQVIKEVFGTEEKPTKGKFYKINDSEVEKTVTDKIYRDLLPIEQSLENIKVLDYFPKYITDNFDVKSIEEADTDSKNATIKTDKDGIQYISWEIDKLAPKETKIIKYTLSLKKEFDEKIIGEILDTNKKVDVTYEDFDGSEKTETSDVTPKLKLSAVPKPEPPKDETVKTEPIPKAGAPIFTIAFAVLGILMIFFGYKARNY